MKNALDLIIAKDNKSNRLVAWMFLGFVCLGPCMMFLIMNICGLVNTISAVAILSFASIVFNLIRFTLRREELKKSLRGYDR